MLEQNKAPSKVSTDTSSARRGFLKKAAISAPILTTIAARPVWAGQCSLSGNLSNNVSNHDPSTHCFAQGYSPGGWLHGHANNNGYWAKISLDKTDKLSTLLSVSPHTSITIGEALSGPSSPHIPQGEKGLWRQRAAAALNLCLWNIMKDCALSVSCNVSSEFSSVSDDFYFETTLAIIMSADETTLGNANNFL